MTTTNSTYKVSTIKPSAAEEKVDFKSQQANGPEDAYKSTSADAYKDLINGNFKAEPINGGVLSEMADASHKERRLKRDYHSQMQNVIGSLMMGDARQTPASDTVGDIPYVPKLEEDIFKGTSLHKHMEPIVQRYAALEKVLISMYDNLRVSLHPTRTCNMTSFEIRSLYSYKEKLKEALGACRTQLGRAHDYYQKQLKEEAEGDGFSYEIVDIFED